MRRVYEGDKEGGESREEGSKGKVEYGEREVR